MTLPDHLGNERTLAELAGGDPLLLQIYRSWWCPEEQAFFRNLVARQAEAEAEVAAAFRAGLGARWTFPSDTHVVEVVAQALRTGRAVFDAENDVENVKEGTVTG